MSCTLAPWPFSGDALDLPVRARAIADRPYASALDLGESLARAEWLTLAFRVRPG